MCVAVEWGEASEGCELEEGGVVFSSGESGVPFNFAMLSTPLTTGRHSWSVTLVDGRGPNVAFGVATAK